MQHCNRYSAIVPHHSQKSRRNSTTHRTIPTTWFEALLSILSACKIIKSTGRAITITTSAIIALWGGGKSLLTAWRRLVVTLQPIQSLPRGSRAPETRGPSPPRRGPDAGPGQVDSVARASLLPSSVLCQPVFGVLRGVCITASASLASVCFLHGHRCVRGSASVAE